MFVATKLLSLQIFVMTTHLRDNKKNLLRQNYTCRDKTFAATKLCLLRQNIFVATKVLSWQIFVMKNTCLLQQKFCHNKHTKVLSWQNCLLRQQYFCHETCILLSRQKTCFVMTNTCLLFVRTNTCLSWQSFCSDKNYACGSSCQWCTSASRAIIGSLFSIPEQARNSGISGSFNFIFSCAVCDVWQGWWIRLPPVIWWTVRWKYFRHPSWLIGNFNKLLKAKRCQKNVKPVLIWYDMTHALHGWLYVKSWINPNVCVYMCTRAHTHTHTHKHYNPISDPTTFNIIKRIQQHSIATLKNQPEKRINTM